jgi:hypothetical protein
MKEMIEKLKQYLHQNQAKFHQHYDMAGDTETGFYEEDVFDFDAMLKQIDNFSEKFLKG